MALKQSSLPGNFHATMPLRRQPAPPSALLWDRRGYGGRHLRQRRSGSARPPCDWVGKHGAGRRRPVDAGTATLAVEHRLGRTLELRSRMLTPSRSTRRWSVWRRQAAIRAMVLASPLAWCRHSARRGELRPRSGGGPGAAGTGRRPWRTTANHIGRRRPRSSGITHSERLHGRRCGPTTGVWRTGVDLGPRPQLAGAVGLHPARHLLCLRRDRPVGSGPPSPQRSTGICGRIWQPAMFSEALMRLHWTYLVAGEYEQATAHAEKRTGWAWKAITWMRRR